MHFRNRSFRPVMLGTNKNSRRPTSSWNSSSFLIHLIVSAPPSTLAEDKTHFGFLLRQLPYLLLLSLSSALCQCILPTFCRGLSWESPRSLPSFGVSRLPLCDGCIYRMFLCSTETQKSSPLSRLITHTSAMPCSLSSYHGLDANLHPWEPLCPIFSSQGRRHSMPTLFHLV